MSKFSWIFGTYWILAKTQIYLFGDNPTPLVWLYRLPVRPLARTTDRPFTNLLSSIRSTVFVLEKNKTFPYWSMDDVKTIGRIESKFPCHTGIRCQNIFYSTRILCFKKYMKRLWHTISYRIKMILIMFRSCTRHQFEHFHFILSTYFENCYA